MHILVIESEDIQRNQLRKYLLRAHYFVDQAQTYAAAVNQLALREYDFILLAQELPTD